MLGDINEMNLITVISSRHLLYFCINHGTHHIPFILTDQQKDNINCTQPLASSTFTSDHSLHQRVLARLSLQLHAPSTIWCYQCIIIHFQGRFLCLQCMLSADSVLLVPEVTFLLFHISDDSAYI